MKALIINSNDYDGGAARAAYRLNKGLRSIDVQSNMLVQNKNTDDFSVIGPQNNLQKAIGIARPHLDKLPLKIYTNRENSPWSVSWIPNNINRIIKSMEPDIINTHWICGGYLSISDINRLRYPMVWTLHDSWPFTGGCHLPFDCIKYEKGCHKCPQIKSKFSYDLSTIIFNRKRKFWANKKFTIVAPSKWLGNCAKSSYLFQNMRIEIIPNGIDVDQFKPIEKTKARKLLRIPLNKKLILFGAINSIKDYNKGSEYLQKALLSLSKISAFKENIELMVFGASEPQKPINFSFKTNYIGKIHDELMLSLVYSAADIFVAPSRSENLPNTVMESLSCGTPCVAFDIGGISDLIENRVNGYLCKPFNAEEFAYGIQWVLEDEERNIKLRHDSRNKIIKQFEINDISRRYYNLYWDVINNK